MNMKYLYFFVLMTTLFLIPNSTNASSGSGACSWHGGVDCSQIDLDTTNVVCKDGWKGSSVSYVTVCTDTYLEALNYLALVDCKIELRSGDDAVLNLCIKNSQLNRMKIGFPDCPEAIHHDFALPSTYQCISYQDYCAEPYSKGYIWDGVKKECVTSNVSETNNAILPIQNISNNIYDFNLTNRLSGNILLQVDDHGEAWYLSPKDNKRYYMKDGSVAYEMMRAFGLGVTDSDLNKIPLANSTDDIKNASSICASNSLANRMKGKILLQVQQRGEAYYIYPKNCRRIYMKDGDAAYQIMRFLGLGITNGDLEKIPSN